MSDKRSNLTIDSAGGKSYFLTQDYNYELNETKSLDSIIEEISYSPLISESPIILSGYNKIISQPNGLLLGDRTLGYVMLFDKNGTYKRNVGKLGTGPGSYQSVHDVNFDMFNNQIQVLSNASQSFIRYDQDGTFLEEQKFKFFASGFHNISKNRIAFFTNQNPSKVADSTNILITDENHRILSEGFHWSNRLPNASFEYTGGFDLGNNGKFFMPFSDSIYTINEKGAHIESVLRFEGKRLQKGFKYIPHNKDLLDYSWPLNPMVDTENYIFIRGNNNAKLTMFVINKKTGKLINNDFAQGIIPLRFFFEVMGADKEGYFYSLIRMNEIHNYLKKHPETIKIIKDRHKALAQIIEKTTGLDNPIIVKYKYSF